MTWSPFYYAWFSLLLVKENYLVLKLIITLVPSLLSNNYKLLVALRGFTSYPEELLITRINITLGVKPKCKLRLWQMLSKLSGLAVFEWLSNNTSFHIYNNICRIVGFDYSNIFMKSQSFNFKNVYILFLFIRIYVKGNSLSSTQGKVEIKINNVRDISLDVVSEASIQKDNVDLKVQAHSEELGLKNFMGSIISKDAGSGKRLEFFSSNDGKNVLSGRWDF